MDSKPILTPRKKSSLPEKFSSEEDQTHDAASSRTASPTHYQRAIPAPHSERGDRQQIETRETFLFRPYHPVHPILTIVVLKDSRSLGKRRRNKSADQGTRCQTSTAQFAPPPPSLSVSLSLSPPPPPFSLLPSLLPPVFCVPSWFFFVLFWVFLWLFCFAFSLVFFHWILNTSRTRFKRM